MAAHDESGARGPAPSPGRAVYGYVLYMLSALAGALYLVWALMPPDWLAMCGLDYWPQQSWTLILPTMLVCALGLLITAYPLLGLLHVPSLDERRIIFDSQTLPHREKAHPDALPPAYDLDPSDVCRTLYS